MPENEKSPIENAECRPGKHACSLECSPEPRCGAGLYTFSRKKGQISKHGKYDFAALLPFKIEAWHAVHLRTSHGAETCPTLGSHLALTFPLFPKNVWERGADELACFRAKLGACSKLRCDCPALHR